MARIGGVKVSEGGKIYWGTFLSVLFSAPVAAYYLGAVKTLQAIGRGIESALGGVADTLAGFTAALFAGPTGALKTAQESFARAVSKLPETTVTVPSGVVAAVPGVTSSSVPEQLSLGPFTFAFSVVVGIVSLWAFLQGIKMARGGLRG